MTANRMSLLYHRQWPSWKKVSLLRPISTKFHFNSLYPSSPKWSYSSSSGSAWACTTPVNTHFDLNLACVEEVTADSLIAASKSSSSSSSISSKKVNKVYGVTAMAQLRKKSQNTFRKSNTTGSTTKNTDTVEVLSITDSELESFNF